MNENSKFSLGLPNYGDVIVKSKYQTEPKTCKLKIAMVQIFKCLPTTWSGFSRFKQVDWKIEVWLIVNADQLTDVASCRDILYKVWPMW